MLKGGGLYTSGGSGVSATSGRIWSLVTQGFVTPGVGAGRPIDGGGSTPGTLALRTLSSTERPDMHLGEDLAR